MTQPESNTLDLTFTFEFEDASKVSIDIAKEGVWLSHGGSGRTFTWKEWNGLHELLEEWRRKIV